MINLIAINKKNTDISTSNLHIFDMIDILVKKYKYEIIEISLLFMKNINSYFKKKYGKLPDNILVFKGSSAIKDFETDYDIKISFFIDDIHGGGKTRINRKRSLSRVINVFNTYAYAFHKYYFKIQYWYQKTKNPYFLTDYSGNLLWLPHSTRFTDIPFNNKPIKKIIITGRLNKRVYPNRQIIYNFSKIRKDIKYLKPNIGYRIKISNNKKNLIYGKKFYLYINQYLCGFTCDLIPKRPYLVAKHFEIMASGALLLACNPNTKQYFQMLGYNDMEHYISCDPDNIEEKTNFILNPDNRELIDKIRKTGYEYTIQNHNYEVRTDFLHDVLTNNYNDSKYDVYKSFMSNK